MISVIIPTYNRAKTIKRSVESVLGQSYTDLEVLVIDDCSTDDTYEVLKEIKDDRLKYICSEKKVGANGARNIGIKQAKGEYIAFQDSDDVWKEEKLEKQLAILENNVEIGAVFSRYNRLLLNGQAENVPNYSLSQEVINNNMVNILARKNIVGTPTLLMRTECFGSIGLFDEKIPRLQDWEMCIRFIQKYNIFMLDDSLLDAYEMEESITRSSESLIIAEAMIFKKHENFFSVQGTLDLHLTSLIDLVQEERNLNNIQEVLGNSLFLKSIYLNRNKNRLNMDCMKKWLQTGVAEQKVNSFFQQYGSGEIAVYGVGILGQLLLNSLLKLNKEKVGFVIDQGIASLEGYTIKSLESLSTKDFNSIKCVIITVINYEDDIRRNLSCITSVSLISLKEILE